MEREFETIRLRLRPFIADDLDHLHHLWINPDVRRYLWDDLEISRDRAAGEIVKSSESLRSRGFGFWALILKDDETLIGFCGLRVFADPADIELLYGIAPSHWGQGLATEAAAAVLNYGFQACRLPKIYAGADAPNRASFRVIENSE